MHNPLILVTNDDGVQAPGVRALHEAVGTLGRAVIVAPERDNSAVSHALTMNRPLRVVAPTSVKRGRFRRTLRALTP